MRSFFSDSEKALQSSERSLLLAGGGSSSQLAQSPNARSEAIGHTQRSRTSRSRRAASGSPPPTLVLSLRYFSSTFYEKPAELSPLTAELWLPENYCPSSAALQLSAAQVFSACSRVTSSAEGMVAGYLLLSSWGLEPR